MLFLYINVAPKVYKSELTQWNFFHFFPLIPSVWQSFIGFPSKFKTISNSGFKHCFELKIVISVQMLSLFLFPKSGQWDSLNTLFPVYNYLAVILCQDSKQERRLKHALPDMPGYNFKQRGSSLRSKFPAQLGCENNEERPLYALRDTDSGD